MLLQTKQELLQYKVAESLLIITILWRIEEHNGCFFGGGVLLNLLNYYNQIIFLSNSIS